MSVAVFEMVIQFYQKIDCFFYSTKRYTVRINIFWNTVAAICHYDKQGNMKYHAQRTHL